ncbi:hypothetical protein KKC74_09170, partial [bacterium]|nr:hypothetical protein [bacterium]
MTAKLSKNVTIIFLALLIFTCAFAEEKTVPQVGENYVFSAKNQSFYSGYYNLSASCRKEGAGYRIFTEDVRVNDINISPINPDYMLLATSSGSYVSYDAGINWQAVNGNGNYMLPPGNNTANFPEYSLPAVHRASINTTMYMNEGAWWCGGQFGAFRSSDNGLNWSIKTRGLPSYFEENEYNQVYPEIHNFKMDSRIVDFENNRDFFTCSDAGLLYWASSKFVDLSKGLPKTANGWDHLSVYDFINFADTAFIATEKGIYKGVFDLDNKCVSWIPLGGETVIIDSSVYDRNSGHVKLYLGGAESNVYVNIMDAAKSLYWIDKIKTEENVFFIELYSDRLYYSDATVFDPTGLDYSTYDGSGLIVYLPPNEKVTRILNIDSEMFFLSQTLLYSINSSNNVALVRNFGTDVYDLAATDGKMYVATASGLYSSDLGSLQSWIKETSYISSFNGQTEHEYDVRSIEINPFGDIYIGCYNGGLMVKKASSGEWINLNAGLGHRDLNLSKVEFISKAFDSLSVHMTIRDYFGELPDIDVDGKMNFLLMDIQDYYYLDAGDGVTFIDGYYDPINQLDPQMESRSNSSDIIYIDSDPLDLLTTDGYAATVHHLAESVLLSQEVQEELWVFKGLGELAEFICGFKDINKEYRMALNNSLTTWNNVRPELKDYEFSYLVFLYLYEHYFTSKPGEDFNKSIKAIVDCSGTGVNGINTCLSNAGYSADFGEIFTDIAISTILDQVETDNVFFKKYQWENAKVILSNRYLGWGFSGNDNSPYYSSIKNWASIVYKTTGMSSGFNWSPELEDLLTFQGSSDHRYKVYTIFSAQSTPDENVSLAEMNLDNKNWGSEDIAQFGDPDDLYQTLYTIVVQCTDSDQFTGDGHFILSDNFDDYYSNPWTYYNTQPLAGYFRYAPTGIQLKWDDVYLGSDDAKQDVTSVEVDKMDAQSFKEYNYSKAASKEINGVKISSLDGFEGFNVYKTDVIEYQNYQELSDGPDSTFHHFSELPDRDRIYKGEIELRIKSL